MNDGSEMMWREAVFIKSMTVYKHLLVGIEENQETCHNSRPLE
jgi:hypothetical protein